MHGAWRQRPGDDRTSVPDQAGPEDARDPGRLLIVTDAWYPQINGVVVTLGHLKRNLEAMGMAVDMLTPAGFRTVPMPSYPAIRLALATPRRVERLIGEARPGHVHIATEGPLGLLARRYCLRRGVVFTTSYHTRFPEYLRSRLPVPVAWAYAWLRRFHNAGAGTLVATRSLTEDLSQRGFHNLRLWSRGVDTDLFRPDHPPSLDLPHPIFLYVGRVAIEKNLPAFLDLDLPGSKVVVGDGPALASLRARYPAAVFLGLRSGEELASIYASSDVFVFPSRTDTFGIVLLEALASGLPVAAFPVTGPADVLADGRGGVLSEDLRQAALAALAVSRGEARAKALGFGWAACARLFLTHVRGAHALRKGAGATAIGPARTT